MSDSLRGWVPLLVCCVGLFDATVAPAQAADNLPALRVDPALLLSPDEARALASKRAQQRAEQRRLELEAAPAPTATRPPPPPSGTTVTPIAPPTATEPAPGPAAGPGQPHTAEPSSAVPATTAKPATHPAPLGSGLSAPRGANAGPQSEAPDGRPTGAPAPAAVSSQAAPPPTPAPTPTPTPAPAPAAPAATPAEPLQSLRESPPNSSAGGVPPTREEKSAAEQPALRPMLRPAALPLPSASDRQTAPTVLTADRVSGTTDVLTEAQGNVELRRARTVVSADTLSYKHRDDEVLASGDVRVQQDADLITGPRLRLRIDDSVGEMESPSYAINRPPRPESGRTGTVGSGTAELLEFRGEQHFHLRDATYSTCSPGRQDWYMKMGELDLDYEHEEGEARDAKLYFKDIPLLYSPWLGFSLNNRRKSGILAPTVGASSRTGTEVSIPYYWNIAPNRDATITPRILSRRGLMLGGEFRYLEPSYTGTLQAEYLPKDNLTGESRHQYAVTHTQNLGYGLIGSLNLNGVSDALYYTDLSSRITNTSQQLLVRQGTLNYSGNWWNASVLAQSYQVLQHPSLPAITVPYERLPQLVVTGSRPDLSGFDVSFYGEFVDFHHPTATIGKRLTAYPQISYPLHSSAYFLIPKIGAHITRYSLERQAAGTPSDITRSLPILSLDSGLIFERDIKLFGGAYTQTLEPRLFYVYVPYRNQSQIPVFDSGPTDFNFAQIFSEFIYAGNDRVANANEITAAVSSRLIDPGSGDELLRATVGQRYYFADQRVNFPGIATRSHDSSDLLAALSGRITRHLRIETAMQYNPNENQLSRLVLGGRYTPSPLQLLNASYRYQRDVLRDIDISTQWPLSEHWYGVGRYNYSLRDKRVVEVIGGLEYAGDCWVLRGVFQRFATATQTSNTAFFLQLELNGFTRLGSNPLDMLKRSIPGYGRVNHPSADPAFGQ